MAPARMSAALQPITAPSCCRSAQIDPLHKPKTTPIFQKLPALRESAVLTGNSELISRYCEKCGLDSTMAASDKPEFRS